MRRIFAIGLVCLAMFASDAQAQKQPTTPGDVAKAFFESAAAHRWREAAGYLDLDAFERYRHQMVESVRHPGRMPPVTAAMLMKQNPDMPQAAAEYQVRQVEKMRGDSSRWLRYEFADVRSVSDLAALSTVDAAARWIEAQDFGYKRREAVKQDTAGCRKSAQAFLPDVTAQPNHILGVVVRDSVAYVLHESSDMEAMASKRESSVAPGTRLTGARVTEWFTMPPHVMQLRLTNGKWLILGGQGLLDDGFIVSIECVEDGASKK